MSRGLSLLASIDSNARPEHVTLGRPSLTPVDQASGLRRMPRPGEIERHARQRAPGAPLRVAVTSGKGGVGKTTVASNLAAIWARSGRRTLVVDGDLGLACMDLALGVAPRLDLVDHLEGRAALDDVLVGGPFGMQLLPASSGRFDAANLGASGRAALRRAIDAVAARFEVVVVDTGAGLGATAVELAGNADEVVLVTTAEPAALRDAYAMTKVLSERTALPLLRVVVNQVDQLSDGHRTYERLVGLAARFLEIRLAYGGGLARDVALAEGAAHGVPLALAEPSSQPARVLGDLVSQLDREVVTKPC